METSASGETQDFCVSTYGNDALIPDMENAQMKKYLRPLPLLFALVAFAIVAVAQQNGTGQPAPNPLVQLLQSKGIITEQEAAAINQAASPDEAQRRLAKLLLDKGVISQQEYDQANTVPQAAPVVRTQQDRTGAAVGNKTPPPPQNPEFVSAHTSQRPAPPAMVSAAAPLRLLPITIPKKDGLTPDIKLGGGVRLRPYGFFKTSIVQQTASHGGATFGSNDFPQGPLLLGDTGPDGDPQFHIKARSLRLGADFEWPDPAHNLTLTGKLEFDFEGNFTDVNNRNISANRSSQPSLRLAWVRMDTKLGHLPVFVQFGQDWSIFGSSTLMDLFETTGFGFAQGNLYERIPMVRAGVQFGGEEFKVQPEFAIVLPSFGEPTLDTDQRTRFGGRVGPESDQPEIQSRLVFQFPLSHAEGVLPAWVVFSYDHARRAEIIPASNLPAGPIRNAFPTGLRLNSTRNAWTAEVQLPTPFVTVASKYYRGGDLRYYFQGQFNDIFTDLGGAPSIGSAMSFSGRTIPFASLGGQIVPARLEPVLGQGGFLQLAFPLSRILHANPAGRNAGWTFYLTYGVDSAFAKDSIRANGLLRTDHGSLQLRYKLNKWVTFAHEVTYLDTHTVDGVLKSFRGLPVHTAHTVRNEFGTIFTF